MAATPDEGHRISDAELIELEQRIIDMYGDAEKTIQGEIDRYFAEFRAVDEEKKALVDAGKLDRPEWLRWRQNRIAYGQRFNHLRDWLANRVTEANKVAIAYINDETPTIYSLNRNYGAYEVSRTGKGVDFNLHNEQAVRRMIKEQPDLMPEYNPYYPKSLGLKAPEDLKYGKSVITRQVTSGLLLGQSTGQIAQELRKKLINMSIVSSLRAARTAMTAAENGGRQASYEKAAKMGIKLTREWMCTHDMKTRKAHRTADGQKRAANEPFTVGGDKLMFPGDKSLGAKPGNLYNCRCRVYAVIKGHERNSETWDDWHKRHQAEEKEKTKASASPTFVNSHELLYKNSKKIKPIEGYEDVFIHGDAIGFVYNDIDGKESNVSVTEFAEILKNSGQYKGGAIRLFACSSGKDGSITAQGLSNILGVEIMAPSDDVYIYNNGDVIISSDGFTNDGEWRIFKPSKKKGGTS